MRGEVQGALGDELVHKGTEHVAHASGGVMVCGAVQAGRGCVGKSSSRYCSTEKFAAYVRSVGKPRQV